MSASEVGHSLSLHAGKVVLDVLMVGEISRKGVLVQIRLQAEYFLCNLLVFSLDSLKLSLTLVKVEALCFELNIGDGVTLAKSGLRLIDGRLFASGDLDQLL